MAITCVTTTKNRPLCFGILEGWMKRQTVQPDQWLVINDSEYPFEYDYNLGQDIVLRDGTIPRYRKRSKNKDPISKKFLGGARPILPSICENWRLAVRHIRYEKVIVIEDDDYYHPAYVETMAGLLDAYELAGVKEDVYFKLRSKKFLRMHNQNHASLAATAFRRSLLPQVERCCTVFKSVFIDQYLWAECTDTLREPPVKWGLVANKAPDGRAFHVGMKQMPGAAGLGRGHGEDGSTDPTLAVLQQWIGVADCRVYRNLPASSWGKPGASKGAA